MLRPARAPWRPELLDQPGNDPVVLADSFQHIGRFNRMLGGFASLWQTIRPLLSTSRGNTLLDVGSGSGVLAFELRERAHRAGIALNVCAVDRMAETIALARAGANGTPIRLASADALGLPFRNGAFDVALLSLTLHHVPDERQTDALRELGRVARTVVVAELARSWANYAGALLLAATFWRDNPLCRHDGPVSVLRGYTAEELLALAESAGLRSPLVLRAFFQRLVLVAKGRPA
jgi:SAM-dependent methyltransferase